jgi:N-acetylglucosamine kinase-like BadF-type ATPase/plasmid maintenance system antidote protein VapI
MIEKRQILTTIAQNLRTLMDKKGLSSTSLARTCKISTGTISKIINGNMSITIPMAMNLAEGLEVDINDLLKGLAQKNRNEKNLAEIVPNKKHDISIGILSINNKRLTCIKNHAAQIIGTSTLEGGLDLTETSGNLIHLINESIFQAMPKGSVKESLLKNAKLNLVTQSYEFEDTRSKFVFFAQRSFKEVMLLPDWQITYLAAFEKEPGISLVTDKGVSLSYKQNGKLHKLGGWKFPVYDLGGENWLGVETIRHTIEAVEGYIPMSKLARDVLAKFNGKIEKITETCFKGNKDPDIYCTFTQILLRKYFTGDKIAKKILEQGFGAISQLIARVDQITGKKFKIALNGSLADVYKEFFNKTRLINSSSDAEKVRLLADLTKESLAQCGITNE